MNNGTTYYYVISTLSGDTQSVDSPVVSVTPSASPSWISRASWRLENFGTSGNSGDAANAADPDGDGWTNQQEYVSGTDPKNRTSLLEFSQVSAIGGDTQLSFATVAGKTYRIERSDSLAPDSWTVVQDNINGTGGVVTCSDTNGAGLPKRFYRIIAQ